MAGRSSSSTTWSRLLRGEEKEEQVDQLLEQFQDESALQLNLKSHRLVKPLNSSMNSAYGDAGGFDYAGLDDELARRYSRLKAPPPAKLQIVKSIKPQISDKKENTHLENSIDNDSRTKSDLEKDPILVGGVGENEGIGRKYRVLVDEEEEKILGKELALRLAALKTPSNAENFVINDGHGLAITRGDQGFDSREARLGIQKEKSGDFGETGSVKQNELDSTITRGDQGFDSREARLGIQKGKSGDFGETGSVKQNELDSEEEQVQRLLASVQDSIKLERNRVSGISSSSDLFNNVGDEKHVDDEEEISESEVENIVEWAKDTARLGLPDSEEEEDDDDNYEDESDCDEEQSAGTRKTKK